MERVVKVCPGCGIPVVIAMSSHEYKKYKYGCPIEELDDLSPQDKTQLETGMCTTCLESSNQAIKLLLEEELNND